MLFSTTGEKIPIKLFSKYNENKINVLAYIVDDCNLECQYCYNKRPRSKKYLNLDRLYKFIVELQKQSGKYISLDLIGGEPTLHPDLISFCKKIALNKFISICIYTNFTRDLVYFCNLIHKNINFSITYHYQSNLENFINKVLEFKEKSTQINLTIMYEKNYSEQIINVFKNLIKFDFQTLELALVMKDTSNRIPIDYSEKQLKQYYEICNQQKNQIKEFSVQYSDNTVDEMSFYDFQKNTSISTQFWKCNAGIEYLDIDVEGNVFSCVASKNKIFNIYNEIKTFRIPTKPILCKVKYCQCRWDITKERVFK